MKSEWEVTCNYIGGERFYGVYRLRNRKEVDHSGNRETPDVQFFAAIENLLGRKLNPQDEAEAEKIARLLNAAPKGQPMNKPIPIREIRIMYAEEVQQILIRNDWFALATNEEYAQFLDYVRRLEGTHVTLEDLRQMAVDVMRYSDPDTYDQETGIPGIMFELARAVHSIYTETQKTEEKRNE